MFFPANWNKMCNFAADFEIVKQSFHMSLPDKYIKDPASSQPACGLCTPECGDPKNLSSSNLKHET